MGWDSKNFEQIYRIVYDADMFSLMELYNCFQADNFFEFIWEIEELPLFCARIHSFDDEIQDIISKSPEFSYSKKYFYYQDAKKLVSFDSIKDMNCPISLCQLVDFLCVEDNVWEMLEQIPDNEILHRIQEEVR